MAGDEKHTHKYEPRPIPSYEEATSSRASTPATHDEAGNTEERRGLMGDHQERGSLRPLTTPTRRAGYRPPLTPGYRPPTVEDAPESDRDSLDAIDLLDAHARRGSEEEVRREMEEMGIEDPTQDRSAWGKRMASISKSIRWPQSFNFTWRIPKLNLGMPSQEILMLIARIVAMFLVIGVVYLLFMSDLFTSAASRMTGQMFDPESVRVFVTEQMDSSSIRGYLEHVTSYDHIAGTEGDYALGEWVHAMFTKAGLEQVWKDEYHVYLNYPKAGGRAVEILKADGSVEWAAKIDEERAYPDGRQQTMAFHGHSKSGDVSGPLIYANYGSREDFKVLYDSGIETTGAIALVRYYGSQGDRALKVKAAELAGFAGCIIYSDPAEDGFVKGPAFPDGRYMPADGVQRGAVSLMSWAVGDVLTPGWPSKKGQLRLQPEAATALNKIPSIPLSWRDAQPLLKAIKGYGQAMPKEWHGGVPEVEWWSGNLSSPIVHLRNEQDEVNEQPIWNVMGRIKGVEQKEKRVIVGNHRDAWCYGATDPGSGTAVMLEVVRIFGMLVQRGWRPLRTIEFANWDGEEYNLIGSTEYVEDNMKMLRKDGYAYLNVDVAVSGDDFHAAASPVFKRSLLRVLDRISHPVKNDTTVRADWDARRSKLEGLGAGSDYVAFQDFAGVSSFDMGFGGEPFPYHSVYDNFEWMEKFGDPGFSRHRTLAQIWALLILEVADRPILPFDMEAYSSSINHWTMDLRLWSENKGANVDGAPKFDLSPLEDAVLQLAQDVIEFSKWEEAWMTNVYATGGFEPAAWGKQRLAHNDCMADFDRDLLDLEPGGGLKGRTQFRHILFAPQLWSGYEEAYYPAIRDAVEAKDWKLAQESVEKAARIISNAGKNLSGRK